MTKYLVSYDLIKDQKDYPKLFEKLRSYPNWCKPLLSTWIIESAHPTSFKVAEELAAFIDGNDKLIVLTLTGDWASLRLGKEVDDWMKASMP